MQFCHISSILHFSPYTHMQNLREYRIVAHVHDEVVLEVPKDSVTVEDVTRIMNENPSWAEGLPLSSAGYFGPDFYFKD